MDDDTILDPFDPAVFGIPPETRAIFGKELQQLGQFTKFPNTWAWRLRESPATSWKLARYLLWRSWLRHRQGIEGAFPVSAAACAHWGISVDGKRRALIELAELGLIRVNRQAHHSPLVVVLFPGPDVDEPKE